MPGNWHKERVSDKKMDLRDVIWLFRLCSIWQLERLILDEDSCQMGMIVRISSVVDI